MTEDEWLACADVQELVRVVIIPQYRPIGLSVARIGLRRKIRLFCCACCHRISHLLTDPRDQAALRIAESFAEKPGTFRLDKRPRVVCGAVAGAVDGCAITTPHNARALIYSNALRQSLPPEPPHDTENAAQAHLFRDVFGNPFRPLPTIDPTWLTWNTRMVAKMARSAYDDRAFDRLPILADALEDAGCTDAAILEHLRVPGPHVRGCWVVDLLLGKK
jgi:hypothetical protein